jgi:hypothetical protein
MTGAYFNLLPLRQNSVASNPPTNGVVGERKELWLLVTGIKGSVYDWQVMRKSGVIRGNRSAGTFVAGGNTRPAHMLETMNFIQVPLKMTLRFMSRNKVFAVLVGISGLAGVLSLVVWRSTAHLEQDIHQDIDSLRGNMRNMASTLQDINSRLSNSNKQDADDVAKPMYWLEAKTESRLQRVIQVFERLGFQRGDSDSDWTVLWSFEYLFNKYRSKFQHLKSHQKAHILSTCI